MSFKESHSTVRILTIYKFIHFTCFLEYREKLLNDETIYIITALSSKNIIDEIIKYSQVVIQLDNSKDVLFFSPNVNVKTNIPNNEKKFE